MISTQKQPFPSYCFPSAFAEQRSLVPIGEENNLLNNTLWDLFFSNELKLLVLPSPLGFLSPGNGGTEEGVKTIEEGERLLFAMAHQRLIF